MSSRNQIEALSSPKILDETETDYKLNVLNSFSLWTPKDDRSLTPSLKNYGFWESWITAWFVNNVRPGQVALDVGANCGYYTMLFQELVGESGQVIAYEANPRMVELLQRTRQSNNAKFIIKPYAVSDKEGESSITFPGKYYGSASMMVDFNNSDWGSPTTIPVNTVTLDGEYRRGEFNHVDIVKIDVESAEELVWNGAAGLFYQMSAPTIVLEYSPTGTYSENFVNDLLNYGTINRIDERGQEQPVDREWLDGLTDWDMLVLRAD